MQVNLHHVCVSGRHVSYLSVRYGAIVVDGRGFDWLVQSSAQIAVNKDTKNAPGGADVETFTYSCAGLVARVKVDRTTNCKVWDVHPTSDLVTLVLPLMLQLVA